MTNVIVNGQSVQVSAGFLALYRQYHLIGYMGLEDTEYSKQVDLISQRIDQLYQEQQLTVDEDDLTEAMFDLVMA